MAQTTYGVNSPLAVKRFAGAVFNSVGADTFISRNLMANAEAVHTSGKSGQTANAPFVVLNDLEQQAGDKVSFDIFMQLTGRPTFGDDVIENNLEDLTAYTDEIKINQVRHGVDAGGKMTQKRVLTELRYVAKDRLAEYFAQYFAQSGVTVAAGARGISEELLIPPDLDGPIEGASPYDTYDSEHIVYGGAATSKGSLVSTDKMTLGVLDKLVTKATATGGGANGKVRLSPLNKGGKPAWMLLISPLQEYDLRKDVGVGGWLDLQKAAAGKEGNDSFLFKNSLGVYRDVHIKCHQHVTQFDDYGAGSNVRADRAVFLGRQAVAVAFGSAEDKGQRASWVEEKKDYGNRLGVVAGMTYGFKLPKFNNKVVNSYAVDTAVSTNVL